MITALDHLVLTVARTGTRGPVQSVTLRDPDHNLIEIATYGAAPACPRLISPLRAVSFPTPQLPAATIRVPRKPHANPSRIPFVEVSALRG